jgi:hypothetical protein
MLLADQLAVNSELHAQAIQIKNIEMQNLDRYTLLSLISPPPLSSSFTNILPLLLLLSYPPSSSSSSFFFSLSLSLLLLSLSLSLSPSLLLSSRYLQAVGTQAALLAAMIMSTILCDSLVTLGKKGRTRTRTRTERERE